MLGPGMMILFAPLVLGYALHALRGGGSRALSIAAVVVGALETLAVLALLAVICLR